ncbi:MAG TPA: zinc ribbon domain-containing protein [Candidatus Wallbacteria bacterium]|nr:zinc ribbon domain-containing protein [Candidatus Wallbacteria bacterium]
MGKKTVYYIMIAAGAAFILLGLLFLIASMTNPARMNIAAVSGFIGAALMYFSFSAIAHINFNSPDNLAALILKIARKNNGYFTAAEVIARLNITAEKFDEVIDYMLRGRMASEETRDGAIVYKTDSAGSTVKRKCEFCGSEFNVRDSLTSCPSCGGNVKMK